MRKRSDPDFINSFKMIMSGKSPDLQSSSVLVRMKKRTGLLLVEYIWVWFRNIFFHLASLRWTKLRRKKREEEVIIKCALSHIISGFRHDMIVKLCCRHSYCYWVVYSSSSDSTLTGNMSFTSGLTQPTEGTVYIYIYIAEYVWRLGNWEAKGRKWKC